MSIVSVSVLFSQTFESNFESTLDTYLFTLVSPHIYSDSSACSWCWWLVLVVLVVLVVVVRPGSLLPLEQSSPRVTVMTTRQLEQNTSTPWRQIRGQRSECCHQRADRQQVGHIQRQPEVARLVVSVLYLDCCAHQLRDPPHS